MTQIVNPFRELLEPNEKNKDEIPRSERNHGIYVDSEHQLSGAKALAKHSDKYRQKLEGKLLEAEAFTAVWFKASKDLKEALQILQPLMETNPVLKQKLLTVLEMAEANLQFGEEAGIALKTVSCYTDQSDALIRQAQSVLDEMMDSLAVYAGLFLHNQDGHEGQAINLNRTLANHENGKGHTLQTLIFSDKSKISSVTSALTLLKAELNGIQQQIDHDSRESQANSKNC